MPEIVSNIVEVYVFRVVQATPQFLVLRRRSSSSLGETWHSVYGHLLSNETAVDGALRELSEETRLSPIDLYQLESVNMFFVASSDQVHLCAALVARVEAEATPVLNDEHDRYQWLSRDDAIERLHWPGQQRAIREIDELIVAGGVVCDTLRIATPKRRVPRPD